MELRILDHDLQCQNSFIRTEDVDVDEAENHLITVSTMLAHENDTVIRIKTLYYANKKKADGYVLDLLWALQDYIDAISMAYRRPMVHG